MWNALDLTCAANTHTHKHVPLPTHAGNEKQPLISHSNPPREIRNNATDTIIILLSQDHHFDLSYTHGTTDTCCGTCSHVLDVGMIVVGTLNLIGRRSPHDTSNMGHVLTRHTLPYRRMNMIQIICSCSTHRSPRPLSLPHTSVRLRLWKPTPAHQFLHTQKGLL